MNTRLPNNRRQITSGFFGLKKNSICLLITGITENLHYVHAQIHRLLHHPGEIMFGERQKKVHLARVCGATAGNEVKWVTVRAKRSARARFYGSLPEKMTTEVLTGYLSPTKHATMINSGRSRDHYFLDSRTKQEHARPTSDHARTKPEHSRPKQEHSRTKQEHARPKQEHALTKQEVHSRPKQEHSRPNQEHSRPTSDHARPTSDHARPTSDHARPTSEHSRPTSEHSRPTQEDCKTYIWRYFTERAEESGDFA